MTQLYFGHLAAQPHLSHCITTRHGGVCEPPFDTFNLALHVGDNPDQVKANRLLLAKRLDFGPDGLVFMNQVHQSKVERLDQPLAQPLDCDAMITRTPGIALAVMVADCVPLLFFDPKHNAVGVAHAGWRGTLEKIAQKTVFAMQEHFDSNPEDLLVGIGPCIGGECYEVDDKVAHPWKLGLPVSLHSPLKPHGAGRWTLDLQLANKLMLIEAGVAENNIEVMALCTHCEPALFSYRREQKTGRFAGLIGIRGR